MPKQKPPGTSDRPPIPWRRVHDVGRAINPMYVEGQIGGGVMQGIGYALTEEAIVQEGKMLNSNFLDYRMPGPCDMPEIESVIIESLDTEGPYGAK